MFVIETFVPDSSCPYLPCSEVTQFVGAMVGEVLFSLNPNNVSLSFRFLALSGHHLNTQVTPAIVNTCMMPVANGQIQLMGRLFAEQHIRCVHSHH